MMPIPKAGTPIIIDMGSAYVKIGFAGEPGPRFVFPCITGTEKYKAVMADVSTRSIYVGDDAMKMRGVLKVKRPIERTTIMSWEDFYEILNHIFYTLLRIENLSAYPVFYVEPSFIHRESKEYIARVLFETHRVQSLIMVPSPVLSVFAVGLTTGLVVESGHGITTIVPIINGKIYYQAVQKLNLAGMDIINNLRTLLMREGINITSSAVEEIMREIVEKNCYFILNPNNPPKSGENFSYPMPDGTYLNIPQNILYLAPEVLFQPSLINANSQSLPQATISSLYSINSAYWSELLSHIVLSGGNLSYPGFEERYRSELIALLPQLGPIPKPTKNFDSENAPSLKPKKLEAVKSKKKEKDTCSKCGTLVKLIDGKEFCPSCGASMKVAEISLDVKLGATPQNKHKEGKCPHCKKTIKDNTSVFCPYCGKKLILPELPSMSEQTVEENHAPEFSGFYESSDTEGMLKFFVPDNLNHATFYGASILGSLPSFLNLFITHEQFQANPELLYRDISSIF
ncbi:MAG: zinc ribbon domain-containing protein [Promethearchaeota archaeon]